MCEEDSLFSVCRKFNIPQTSVISLNNLKEEIKVGDILYLEKQDGVSYDVQPTDTVKSLSRKFGISESALKEKIGSDYVFYGMTLLL